MPATTVNEGSGAFLTVTFKDKAGAQAAPTSARYRIDCVTTGEEVADWTAMTAAAQVELAITSAQNAMRSEANANELRRVTVEGTYGAGDKVTGEYEYNVANLRFYPAA